jgi:hypothetical protein
MQCKPSCRSLRPGLRPLAPAGLALALLLGGGTRAGAEGRWQVAPAGPCAEAMVREPCTGGACAAGAAPARSRFDPTEVAAGAGGGGAAPPAADSFAGPGSCADPGTPCGSFEPTRVAERPPVEPPPAAPSPADPPTLTPPPPPASPPAPPAPAPPAVVEPPAGPGTLPGLP